MTSFHSEAKKKAILQSNPGASADRLLVNYQENRIQFELSVLGHPLLSGEWSADVSVGERRHSVQGAWDGVCWHADKDGDYLELQLDLDDGLRVDRQFLLSRSGRFALLGDAVIATDSDRLRYSASLPSLSGWRSKPNRTSREVRLSSDGITARVIPLTLPQVLAKNTAGELAAGPDRIRYMTEGAGGALYSAVFIDWSPRRRSASAEWNPLTVSEQRSTLPSHVAAGFRLRVGRYQWLIYRSLRHSGEPRAVLGHHTRYETVIGAFKSTGDVETIVAVE